MGNYGYKLICVDANETLVEEKTWPELNYAMGMTRAENAMFYNLNKNREIDYTMWVNIALGIYKNRHNLKRPAIENIINNYNYFPYAKELISYLKQKYIVVIVSCAMDLLVRRLASELEIDHYKSLTRFIFKKSGHIDKIIVDDRTGDQALNKVHFLNDICEKLEINIDECISVGDGKTDHELFRVTRGITLHHAKLEHKSLAWRVVANLKEITSII